MKRTRIPCYPILVLLLSSSIAINSSPARGADKHPFGVDDYSALHAARAIAVSPDGKTILYRATYDGTTGLQKREWRLIDASGENSRKLDLPENFEPDGFTKDGAALYGLYGPEKKQQLAIVPLAPGKLTQILALPSGIHSAVISPDGTRFAVVANPRAPDPLSDVRHVIENDETSLYVAGVHGEDGAWWCPSLTDITDIAWSSEGSRIAVLTQDMKIGHHDVHSYVSVCSASGPRQIAEIPTAVGGIAWAEGGRELAFASTTTAVLTPEHVWTVPVAGGAAIDRTPNLNGSAVNVAGDAHGNVWVEMHKGVIVEIDGYRNGKLETAYRWPGGCVTLPIAAAAFSSSPDSLAVTAGDPSHANNVAVERNGKLETITHEGDDTLGEVKLGEVRAVNWKSKEGILLEGIATFPAGYDPAKKYPFLVLPHGGPESNDELRFDSFSRLIAGLGYVVLQPEYRGSTGYGSDFLAAIYQHFGDRAYADVDSATDFAIAQGWADPNRLAIFGWSAGGFMTSWTVTQTHRYRAAIEGAGITDWLSFIPTSDIGQIDYDARLQEKDAAPFLEFSAVMHADQVTTPLLILHGEADLRVPTFQGREYFILLAERGKTVRMVTYPGSPHFPLLAEQRRNVFQEIGDWLARYNP